MTLVERIMMTIISVQIHYVNDFREFDVKRYDVILIKIFHKAIRLVLARLKNHQTK